MQKRCYLQLGFTMFYSLFYTRLLFYVLHTRTTWSSPNGIPHKKEYQSRSSYLRHKCSQTGTKPAMGLCRQPKKNKAVELCPVHSTICFCDDSSAGTIILRRLAWPFAFKTIAWPLHKDDTPKIASWLKKRSFQRCLLFAGYEPNAVSWCFDGLFFDLAAPQAFGRT